MKGYNVSSVQHQMDIIENQSKCNAVMVMPLLQQIVFPAAYIQMDAVHLTGGIKVESGTRTEAA